MRSEFIVKGFHCNACEMLVKDVCSDFAEIRSVEVDVKSGKVSLECDDGFDLSQLFGEIESLGEYKVKR